MLSDHQSPKVRVWSIEELNRFGLNADGFPMGQTTASGSVNKENQRSGSYSGSDQHQKAMAEGRRTSRMQNFGGYTNARIYKAGPSVAGPFYQARGHVPQYDGAMDSPSPDTAPVNGGSSEGSIRRSSGQVARAGAQAGSKVSLNAMAPSFYEPTRRFPASAGLHYEAVDKFFNTIREEERAEIARYKAQFPLL